MIHGTPQASIPHRKVIRGWLVSVGKPSYLPALWRIALDAALLVALLVASFSLPHLIPRVVAGALAGLVIGRLFILGHDACHQSLTRNRRLNRWLGRILLLPSLTPCSLWETGHNVVHHGYTNLRTFDFVWQPRTLEEYRAFPPWRQKLERVYRSGWAPGLYYLIEIWWSRMYFPSAHYMPTRRRIFTLDSLLVSAVAFAWIVILGVIAHARGDSIMLALFTGFLLPQIVWNCLIGFIVYVHHTHPGIHWHEDKLSWSVAQPFVSTTVHLQLKKWCGFDAGSFLHHITEHTAHHVDMTIPLYHLKQAQRILESRMPGQIVIQTFSWPWYFDTARRCKLYDYRQNCWTDFLGNPTSATHNNGGVRLAGAVLQ